MANNKQGCRECKFLQTAKSAVESKRKAGNSIREDFHLSSLGARWSRTLSSARLSPVATWQVRSTASESPIPLPTHLYRGGHRRGTALDPAMATATELRSIQLSGNALAQANPGRTQSLDTPALVALLRRKNEQEIVERYIY